MDSPQEKSSAYFTKLALEKKDKTTVAGRYIADGGKEQSIVDEIISRLDFKHKQTLLDIGCGYGFVTESLIGYLTSKNISITLMDIPAIIDAVDQDFIKGKYNNIKLQRGLFPQDFVKENEDGYDRVLLYSVLHYTNDPFDIIEQAVAQLKPYGKLLLGDLPNISKKGRFISSQFGRSFDASYKKVSIDKLPVYRDHFDFVSKMKSDPEYYSLIDDHFIEKVVTTFRAKGFDTYVLPQPDDLPFCNTREDILICRYD